MGKNVEVSAAESAAPAKTSSLAGERNIGLSLLRTWMCFEVVLAHFWRGAHGVWFFQAFDFLRDIAVPVFMIMSFYLTEPLFVSKDINRIKQRMWRVTWPQIGWALIYAAVYGSSLSELLFQALFGHSINRSMWYQFCLIVISALLFFLFYCFSRRTAYKTVIFLALVALIAQYSGINVVLFGSLREELNCSLGRIAETFPMAVVGLLFAKADVLQKMRRDRAAWMAGAVLVFVVVVRLDVFSAVGGFTYAGLKPVILASCLVIFFFLLPLEKLPPFMIKILSVATKHTLGIYCVHRLVEYFLLPETEYRVSEFAFCVLVYFLSWIVCELLSRIPVKVIRQLVD